jgi:putative transposase
MSNLKTFRFKLYPSKAQIVLLEQTLSACCELYNAAVQERRDAWRINRKSINFASQSAQLVDIKAVRTELNGVYSQVLQDTLHRVDKTFKAFFGRVKRKAKAGFPRFRSHTRYDSLTYPQLGFSIEGSKLRMSKIGRVKIKLHRPIEGKIKTLTIKREAGNWFACFAVECAVEALPVSTESIGIDVGLTTFATLSDGVEIENPRYFKESQARLRKAQRKVARRKKGGNSRRKAVQLLQRAHAHIRNQRSDFHHKISQWIVANYGLIAVEDLNLKGLASGMLAKSVNDAGWGMFLDKIAYKAANAGRQFFRVNPNGTTQTCSGCGSHVPKDLSQRVHQCPTCNLTTGRDENAAINILGLGLSLQSATCTAR